MIDWRANTLAQGKSNGLQDAGSWPNKRAFCLLNPVSVDVSKTPDGLVAIKPPDAAAPPP